MLQPAEPRQAPFLPHHPATPSSKTLPPLLLLPAKADLQQMEMRKGDTSMRLMTLKKQGSCHPHPGVRLSGSTVPP
jgi:hypothetical protein